MSKMRTSGLPMHARDGRPIEASGAIGRREARREIILFPVVDDEIRAGGLRCEIAKRRIERVFLQPVVPQRDSVGVVSHAAAVLHRQDDRIGRGP